MKTTSWPIFYEGWEYLLLFVGGVHHDRKVGHCRPAKDDAFGNLAGHKWPDCNQPEWDGYVLYCKVCKEDMPVSVFRYFMKARKLICSAL